MTKAVIYVLGKQKVVSGAKKIVHYIEGGSGDDKTLIQALIEIGPPSEEPVLPHLESKHNSVISMAIQLLADVGGEKGVDPVEKLTTTKDEQVANAVKTTSSRIEECLKK